jgi:hypothetical protein
MVHNENELAATLAQWLRDVQWRSGVAVRAESVMSRHRGASRRVAQIVAAALSSTHDAT